MRVVACALALLLVGLAAGEARPCTRIGSIPADCEMRVVECAPPGPDSRARVTLLSLVLMKQPWARSAASLAPDRLASIVHEEDEHVLLPAEPDTAWLGFARDPGLQPMPNHPAWSPDGRWFAYWAGGGEPGPRVALIDARRPDAAAAPVRLPAGVVPTWFVWAPRADALVVVSTDRRVWRVAAGGGEVRPLEVARPVTNLVAPHHPLADGAGTEVVAFLGDDRELWLLDVEDGRLRPLGLPDLVTGVEFSHDQRRLLVNYRRQLPGPDGARLFGLVLIDLDPVRRGAPATALALHEDTDVHTEWFSPDDRLALWATPEQVVVRDLTRPDAGPRVLLRAGAGEEVTGAAFDRAGARVAITAGARLLVHDLAAGSTVEWARLDQPGDLEAFAAEPAWDGEQVRASVFARRDRERGLESLKESMRRGGRPPSPPRDPALGPPRRDGQPR